MYLSPQLNHHLGASTQLKDAVQLQLNAHQDHPLRKPRLQEEGDTAKSVSKPQRFTLVAT